MRQFFIFFLLAIIQGDVGSRLLSTVPQSPGCPRNMIWNKFWQRCEHIAQTAQTDHDMEQPMIAETKIDTASLIGGGTTGCKSGWTYSFRVGKCVWCNREESWYWTEYMGKCVKI